MLADVGPKVVYTKLEDERTTNGAKDELNGITSSRKPRIVKKELNTENDMVKNHTGAEVESIAASSSHNYSLSGPRSLTVEPRSSLLGDEYDDPLKRAVFEVLEVAEWLDVDILEWFELKQGISELHKALIKLGLGLATRQPALKRSLELISAAAVDAVTILSSELAKKEAALYAQEDDAEIENSVLSIGYDALDQIEQEKDSKASDALLNEEVSSFDSDKKNTAWRPDEFVRHGLFLGTTNDTNDQDATTRMFIQSGPQVIAAVNSTLEQDDELKTTFGTVDKENTQFRQRITTWSRTEALAGFGRAVSLCRGNGSQALGAGLAMIRRTLASKEEDTLLNARLTARQAANAFQKHGILVSVPEMAALLAHLDPEARRSRRHGVSARFGPLRIYCFTLREELAQSKRSVWSTTKSIRQRQKPTVRFTVGTTSTTTNRKIVDNDESKKINLIGMKNTTPRASAIKRSKTWEDWVEMQAKRRRAERRHEFRKALAGLSHRLNEFELNDALRKYQVLDTETLDAVVNVFVDRYAQSHDCHFDALKLASGNSSSASMVDEARARKRRALYEGEQVSAQVTRMVWTEFQRVHGVRNKQNKSPKGLIEFVREMILSHAKQKEAVKEWIKKKHRLARIAAIDAKKAAPAPVVESELRNLCARLDRRVGDYQRPSRLGIDIERRLRQLLKSKQKLVTKADVYSNFGTNTAFSLLADPRVAKEALDLIDPETRDVIKSYRNTEENNSKREFVFGEYADTADAEYAADQILQAKRRENRARFNAWKREKVKRTAEEKKRIDLQLNRLEPKLIKAKKAAKRALTRWNKVQHLVEKRRFLCLKQASATRTNSDTNNGHTQNSNNSAMTKLDQALVLHHRRKAEALKVTRRWRSLEKRVSALRKEAISMST